MERLDDARPVPCNVMWCCRIRLLPPLFASPHIAANVVARTNLAWWRVVTG